MSKEKRRVPKLRFPGFTEDWEQRKLSDISTKVTTKNVDVHYTETLTNSAEQGIISQVDFFDKEISNKDNINGYYIVENNDFIYNPRISTLAPVGPINRNKLNRTGIMSPLYTVFRASTVDLDFLEWYFQSSHWHRYMKLNGDSGARADRIAIKDSTFFDMPIKTPVNIKEQVLIGETLEKFNQYVTLHQRKLEHLNLKKKALLQKLFPKNGERYPELRFPGFTDAWEQCKLGEIFEYLQNNALSRDSLNYKNPNIKNIHYGDILVKFDEILDGSNKDIPYINSELDLSKFSKSLLRDGDIIFSDTAEDDTVGKAIELRNVNAPFILGGLHTIPCRPLIPFGKGYLGNFLNSDSYRLQLRPLIQGIKVSSISKSALKDTMIEYPKNLDEQEKIGSLFYYIAKMITLHQRKLEHLQLQKKALLQQMFV